MSLSAVVSYPQVLQQLSTESSEKAKDSQVNAILSQGLRQVLNSLLLISFATQLLWKEGITRLKHESSWDTVVTLFRNSEFIITIPAFSSKLEYQCLENGRARRVIILFPSIDQS